MLNAKELLEVPWLPVRDKFEKEIPIEGYWKGRRKWILGSGMVHGSMQIVVRHYVKAFRRVYQGFWEQTEDSVS